MTKSVFTYALGTKYLKLAFTLARSYRFHNNIASHPFYIISTEDFVLPKDLSWVRKSIYPPHFVGKGLEFKLKLNDLAPTKDSIFIDSDSVIYGSIEPLFEKLSHQSVLVIGTNIINGDWVGENITKCCQEFKIPRMIRYCGAIYLIRKDLSARVIFNEAARLNQSERIFQKHIHHINEEPLISISLSKLNFEPIVDDGNIWSDLVQLRPEQRTNVFNGITLHNHESFKYKFWLPKGFYSPQIVHMGSGIINKAPWLFEYIRLKALYQFHLPIPLIEFCIDYLAIPAYYTIKSSLKFIKRDFFLI